MEKVPEKSGLFGAEPGQEVPRNVLQKVPKGLDAARFTRLQASSHAIP